MTALDGEHRGTLIPQVPALFRGKETGMHLIEMIWNGLGGVGQQAIVLKICFMLFLVALFWISCEFAKHIVTVGSRFLTDALRYLAVAVRGWPEGAEEARLKAKETAQ